MIRITLHDDLTQTAFSSYRSLDDHTHLFLLPFSFTGVHIASLSEVDLAKWRTEISLRNNAVAKRKMRSEQRKLQLAESHRGEPPPGGNRVSAFSTLAESLEASEGASEDDRMDQSPCSSRTASAAGEADHVRDDSTAGAGRTGGFPHENVGVRPSSKNLTSSSGDDPAQIGGNKKGPYAVSSTRSSYLAAVGGVSAFSRDLSSPLSGGLPVPQQESSEVMPLTLSTALLGAPPLGRTGAPGGRRVVQESSSLPDETHTSSVEGGRFSAFAEVVNEMASPSPGRVDGRHLEKYGLFTPEGSSEDSLSRVQTPKGSPLSEEDHSEATKRAGGAVWWGGSHDSSTNAPPKDPTTRPSPPAGGSRAQHSQGETDGSARGETNGSSSPHEETDLRRTDRRSAAASLGLRGRRLDMNEVGPLPATEGAESRTLLADSTTQKTADVEYTYLAIGCPTVFEFGDCHLVFCRVNPFVWFLAPLASVVQKFKHSSVSNVFVLRNGFCGGFQVVGVPQILGGCFFASSSESVSEKDERVAAELGLFRTVAEFCGEKVLRTKYDARVRALLPADFDSHARLKRLGKSVRRQSHPRGAGSAATQRSTPGRAPPSVTSPSSDHRPTMIPSTPQVSPSPAAISHLHTPDDGRSSPSTIVAHSPSARGTPSSLLGNRDPTSETAKLANISLHHTEAETFLIVILISMFLLHISYVLLLIILVTLLMLAPEEVFCLSCRRRGRWVAAGGTSGAGGRGSSGRSKLRYALLFGFVVFVGSHFGGWLPHVLWEKAITGGNGTTAGGGGPTGGKGTTDKNSSNKGSASETIVPTKNVVGKNRSSTSDTVVEEIVREVPTSTPSKPAVSAPTSAPSKSAEEQQLVGLVRPSPTEDDRSAGDATAEDHLRRFEEPLPGPDHAPGSGGARTFTQPPSSSGSGAEKATKNTESKKGAGKKGTGKGGSSAQHDARDVPEGNLPLLLLVIVGIGWLFHTGRLFAEDGAND